jgi:hypothetical protein
MVSGTSIRQWGGGIEFRSHLSPAVRALILIGGMLPLLAPYDLVLKPLSRGGLGAVGWFFVLLSAGAVALSLLAFAGALFSLSQRLRFDRRDGVIVYGFEAALLRYRERRFPFSAVEALDIKRHQWSDDPASFNLVLRLKGFRDIEFGGFAQRVDAELYLTLLQGITAPSSDPGQGTAPTPQS